MRPRHWLKNGFVLAPVVFSGHLLDAAALGRAAAAAAAFCLASSAGYLVNDVADRDADAADPAKRLRPVAAGEMAPRTALAWAAALAVAAVAASAAVGVAVAAAAAAYLLLTVSYSAGLKRVPVLEAMVLAGGFLLRLLGGAAAVPVRASAWLLICGFLLALLLAFGKRMPEAARGGSRAARYPDAFLSRAVTLLAGATVVTYVIYTVAPETVANLGSRALLATAPLVLFGVLRYLLLLDRDGVRDPTEALTADRPLLVTVALWAAAAAVIVSAAAG